MKQDIFYQAMPVHSPETMLLILWHAQACLTTTEVIILTYVLVMQTYETVLQYGAL